MNENKKSKPIGILFLSITAIVWGVSFVSQSVGMEKIDAFSFNGVRTILGSLVLLPVIFIKDKITYKNADEKILADKKRVDKMSIRRGIILAIPFFCATNIQQFAFYYSTAGKIAFITAMYMLFVPIISVILKKKIPLITWVCVFMGIVGLYFLCVNPSDIQDINKGDLLALICAVFFAIHILLVDKLSVGADGIKMSCTQFAISGIISCTCMFIFEEPVLKDFLSVSPAILYSGIMSCGVAYTFQILGQKYTEATVASLIMCAESVFAVIASALLLHELLTLKEALGCIFIFVAVIISQLAPLISKKRDKN